MVTEQDLFSHLSDDETDQTSRFWTPESKAEFVDDYELNGYSLAEMAEKYDKSVATIRRKLATFKVTMRSRGPGGSHPEN